MSIIRGKGTWPGKGKVISKEEKDSDFPAFRFSLSLNQHNYELSAKVNSKLKWFQPSFLYIRFSLLTPIKCNKVLRQRKPKLFHKTGLKLFQSESAFELLHFTCHKFSRKGNPEIIGRSVTKTKEKQIGKKTLPTSEIIIVNEWTQHQEVIYKVLFQF